MINFIKLTGREVFGDLQVGHYPKLNRCLLAATDYDYEWAKQELGPLKSHEMLVRVENELTHIEDGRLASIAKINLTNGSIAFTEGEEGEADFRWGRYSRATVEIIDARIPLHRTKEIQKEITNPTRTTIKKILREFGEYPEDMVEVNSDTVVVYYEPDEVLAEAMIKFIKKQLPAFKATGSMYNEVIQYKNVKPFTEAEKAEYCDPSSIHHY